MRILILLALLIPALVFAEIQVDRDPASGRVVGLRPSLDQPIKSSGDPVSATLRFLADHAALTGLKSPADQLKLFRQEQDKHGNTHLRFYQVHQGVPVYAADVISHFDAEGKLTLVTTIVEPDLPASVTPTLGRRRHSPQLQCPESCHVPCSRGWHPQRL